MRCQRNPSQARKVRVWVRPRPILVNAWYPAASDAGGVMPHSQYLNIASADKRLTKLALALAAYGHEVIRQEVVGQTEKTALDAPTACRRDAKAAAGQYPLVVYHAGCGSSFEDNTVLCEYLASHGYVVIGNPYQEPTGRRSTSTANRRPPATSSS